MGLDLHTEDRAVARDWARRAMKIRRALELTDAAYLIASSAESAIGTT